MPSLFSKIIAGELPGRFVWRDESAVAFLTIAPIQPGHTLVVPIREVDHWLDLAPAEVAHLTAVCHEVGRAIQSVWKPAKVGMMIAGLEVPHVHIHLVPIWSLHDLEFSRANTKPDPAEMDGAAERIRAALRAAGRKEASD